MNHRLRREKALAIIISLLTALLVLELPPSGQSFGLVLVAVDGAIIVAVAGAIVFITLGFKKKVYVVLAVVLLGRILYNIFYSTDNLPNTISLGFLIVLCLAGWGTPSGPSGTSDNADQERDRKQ